MRKSIYNYIHLLFLLFSLAACGQSGKKEKQKEDMRTLPHYDLNNSQVYKLPKVLNEISGITFLNGDANIIYAEQDEEGKLFYFQLGGSDIQETKFGRKGDYEDVQLCNGYVVMLRSDGTLFTFSVNDITAKEVKNVQEFNNLLPRGEYEGLYADNISNKLYVLCKQCDGKSAKTSSGYIFSLSKNGTIQANGNFTINVEQIAAKAGIKKLAFEPSALAKNVQTNEWYIVSSVNKLLVVANNDWTIKEAYPLNADIFNQPEGIAFDKEGNLYMSNEKGNTGSATILKLVYQKP
jgi:uncharacterized protein YjiK